MLEVLPLLAMAQTFETKAVEPAPGPGTYAWEVAATVIEALGQDDRSVLANHTIDEATLVIHLPWTLEENPNTVVPIGKDPSALVGTKVIMNSKSMIMRANKEADYAYATLPYRLVSRDQESHCGIGTIKLMVMDNDWQSDKWRLLKVNLKARPASDCRAIGAPEEPQE